MLRITKQADYGVLLMTLLAATGVGNRVPARRLAESSNVPSPMAAKILKQLAAAGLVDSTRGVNGGYALARPAQTITLHELLTILDGPVALTECAGSTCDLEAGCRTRPMWRTLNSRIVALLEGITLAEMMQPVPDLGPESFGLDRDGCRQLLAAVQAPGASSPDP